MAAPYVASKGTASAVTTGASTPTYPASIVADDIIFLLAISHQPVSIGVIDTPTGFTEVSQGTYQNNSAVNQGRIALFWRRATGSLSGTVSVTRTGDTGVDGCFYTQIYRVVGAKTTGDPWDAFTADYGPGNGTVDFGAVTVSSTERTLLAFCAQANNASTVDPPSGYIGLVSDTTATGTNAELRLSHRRNIDAGTATTATGGETLGWGTFHVSMTPAVAYSAPAKVFSGDAIRFDGAQDVMRLDYADSTGLIYCTMTCWAKISVDRGDYSTIFAIEDGAGHSTAYNELITDADGTTLSVYDHVTGDLGNVQAMAVGTWYAVAVKFTASAWKSYVGTEGFSTLTTNTGTLTNISFNDMTGVGATTFASTEFLNGMLSMFRVWSAALTDDEIKAELQSSRPVRINDLIGSWFPLGVGTGTEVTATYGNNLVSRGIGTPDWTFAAGPNLPIFLSATNIVSTATLYNSTVSNKNTLSTSNIASTASLYAPSLSTGTPVVAPPLIASTLSIYNSTVSNVNSIVASNIASTANLYNSTVSSSNTLSTSNIASTASLYTPSLSTGTSVITPPLIASTLSIYNSTVSNVNSIVASNIASTASVLAPNLIELIEPGALGSSLQIFGPGLTNLNTVQSTVISSGSVVFSPGVTGSGTILAPAIASSLQIFTPNAIDITHAPSIGSTATLYAAAITNDNSIVSPFLINTETLFTPTLTSNSALTMPVIGSTVQLYNSSLAVSIAPISIGSAATVYSPSIAADGYVQPPFIASGAGIFSPTIGTIGMLTVPLIPSSNQFFNSKTIYTIYPAHIGTAVVYTPTVIQWPGFTYSDSIPLAVTLELPMPETLTRIKGIHQSDVIIRSAIVAGLADMRANPWLLDYVFASLPQDSLTWKEYGEKDLQQARKWFVTTDIPISVLPRMDESKFPQITIELLDSTEVVPETTLGDVNYDPEEDNDMTWPALTGAFTPISYTPSTGVVKLSADPAPLVAVGMFLIDRNGKAHEITDVTSQSQFTISPGTVADLRGCVLKGHRPSWKVSVESSSFRESYRIGIHVQGEQAHLTWLHSIVQFALLRYKQVLMEARGFERSTIGSSQVARAEWAEAENVYSRYITISGHVRQFWPKVVAPVIDGVELDKLKVIDSGSIESAGVDPSSQLWTGDEDDED